MKVPQRHRLLGAFETSLLLGLLLGQGAFLLTVVDMLASTAA